MNNYLVSDGSGTITWSSGTAMICPNTCSQLSYLDVANIFATIILVICCVLTIARIAYFSYQFINDIDSGSISNSSFNSTIGGFFWDLLIIFIIIGCLGLIYAMLWIITVPITILIAILLFTRFLVRMNKKLAKL